MLPEWPAPFPPPDLSSDQLHLLTIEGALRLLAHAGGDGGAVALVDDIHDADLETVEFLHHAAAAAREERLFIVGAVRTPEGRWPRPEVRALERADLVTVLELGPLAEADVARIVEAILGVPPPPGLVEQLWARSDGIPLLVEELVDAQLSSGTLRTQWGRAHWSGDAGTVQGMTVPTVVRDKLSRLSATARTVVVTSGLLDRFDPALVAAVADVDPSVVTPASALLVEAGTRSLRAQAPASAHALLRRAAQLARTDATRNEALDAFAGALGALGRSEEALQLDAELVAGQRETAARLTRMAQNASWPGGWPTSTR